MSIYFPESEEIYFKKTREYFKEVVSSYSNENYRSAIVMLYSISICDILFKLQELKDMYNDSVAIKILKKVEGLRNNKDCLLKSKWEKELVDEVYNETNLLDLESYTNLNHLYDYRNFSAHPALNENYELINPTKEITVAFIKSTLTNILIKPPIFIKNVLGMLTDDLNEKSKIYINEYKKLHDYLKNKYFSKMPDSMKFKIFITLWKFCFNKPDDELCMNNLKINRKCLQILTEEIGDEIINKIDDEKEKFSVATDEKCIFSLIVYLSHFPKIYNALAEDVKLHINSVIEKNSNAKAVSWFVCNDYSAHLNILKASYMLHLTEETVEYMVKTYSNLGKESELYDFFVFYYGDSQSFDTADERFELVIAPYLDSFISSQLRDLIEFCNDNSQIYRRWAAYSSNTKIAKAILQKLGKDFDFSEYDNFDFDKSILEETYPPHP
ncbi:hypothetical protein [Treponema sp.]|uniref:hypothetical protein n=1 Tax=Treponema sp. TaxID=166 RepID=UPI003F00771E